MKVPFSLVLLLFISQFSYSQGLNLGQCLKMADTANLQIRNARLDVSINDKQRDAYVSARLPQLSFAGDYKYNAIIPGQVVPGEFFGAPGTFSTIQFGVPYNLSNTVQLTQILYNSQVNYGLNVLKINDELVRQQQVVTEQEIKYQVANTFFNLQAVTKQLAFISSNIKSMDELIKNMDAMVKQDLVVSTELDKLKINRLSLQNSQASLNATKEQLDSYLKILIGSNESGPLVLESDELVQQSILVDQTSIQYPELGLIEAQIKLNQEERKGNNMAYLPNLSLYGVYNYNYNMKPEDDFRVGIEGAFVGLKLDWKLFDGLEKVHKQRVIALTADKLNNQSQLLEQQLNMKSNNAKLQIEVQKNSLEVAREQLKLAENVFAHTELKFKEGLIGSSDLIQEENQLLQAQTNLVTTYIKLRQAELEYLKSIGNIK